MNTGTGKTFLACALAQQACRQGYRVRYWRVSRLFQALHLARVDGTYARLLGQLARVDVLLLDDFALTPLQEQERRDLLEVLEDRYGTRSAIVTSQLPPAQWHETIGEPTVADAICDRLLHNITVLYSKARHDERRTRSKSNRLCQRRFAPFTMTDPVVHDGAIEVFTISEIRRQVEVFAWDMDQPSP